jgi:fructose/tagatose bisphosphate aldolase
MDSLRNMLQKAESNKVAVGHFNISDWVALHDLRVAIAADITVVHINTEVRLAWRCGPDSALAKQPNEIVPHKILPQVVDSIKEVVTARLELFSGVSRARPAAV